MKIAPEQKFELIKLKEQTEELSKQMDELVNKAEEITQEKVDGGFTWDYMLNDMYDVDELLDNLGIEVAE